MDTGGGNDSAHDRTGSGGGECENFEASHIFASVALTEMTDICNWQGGEWQDVYWRSQQGPDQSLVM